MTARAPVMLVVLDGFGLGDGGRGDAVARADAPFFAHARRAFPMARIETSGVAVGLPPGQMGNSEVGHMTLGAGRVIDQDMTRISRAFETHGVGANAVLAEAVESVRARAGARLHLLGLIGDGGVHAHREHLEALLAHCGARGVAPVLHAFLDGRDSPPRSAREALTKLAPKLEACGGRIASLCGRYWAMDRDQHWERTARAHAALVHGRGARAPDAHTALEQSYVAGKSDEFALPVIVGEPAPLRDGDVALCFNFRADRVRQLVAVTSGQHPARYRAGLEAHKEFAPHTAPKLERFVCLTEYDAHFALPVAFPAPRHAHILGEQIADAKLPQLRMAETEKYAHVTFFFNCGVEKPFPLEERVLVPSPREVATYDQKPQMSARALQEKTLEQMAAREYAFVLLNFANPDMVGHTGVLAAATRAVASVGECLAPLVRAVCERGGDVLITADHGNCERMLDARGGPHTAHTTNPVPLWWASGAADAKKHALKNGTLADIAPSILELMNLPRPKEMTGRSLLKR